jgi:hypothetical protein
MMLTRKTTQRGMMKRLVHWLTTLRKQAPKPIEKTALS